MITSAKYSQDGSVTAIIDDQEISNITEGNWRWTQVQEWVAAGNTIETYETPGIQSDAVNAERDRRIQAGFLFAGKLFDFDNESKQRVTGAATLAGFALGAGAQPGNLRWHGGDKDFAWITQDNSLMPMDAQMCFLFGKAAASHESDLIFKARTIKRMTPIPSDFTNDSYWS